MAGRITKAQRGRRRLGTDAAAKAVERMSDAEVARFIAFVHSVRAMVAKHGPQIIDDIRRRIERDVNNSRPKSEAQ